jgi:hypothetical protein
MIIAYLPLAEISVIYAITGAVGKSLFKTILGMFGISADPLKTFDDVQAYKKDIENLQADFYNACEGK